MMSIPPTSADPIARASTRQQKRKLAEPKATETFKLSKKGDSKASSLKEKLVTKKSADSFEKSQVTIEKMVSKKFDGWKIKLDNKPCGFVKLVPKIDDLFKKHVTLDILVPEKSRGKHVGRYAIQKVLDETDHPVIVAHLRKSNIASKKALFAAGFKEFSHATIKQLCMIYRK